MLDCTDSFFSNIEPEPFLTEKISDLLDNVMIPRHVAIIMDGNRRWAKQQYIGDLSALEGHWAGAKAIFSVVEAAKEMGIKVLTLFGFSTENWKRPSLEINLLMQILEQYLREMRPKMVEKGVKFSMIGDPTPFPKAVQEELVLTKSATEENKEIELVFACNYGGKDDLKRAFIKIAEKLEKGEIVKEAIDENLIASYLDTAKWPDPDLLIRTSAEKRVSNFMLWQLAYSEIYFTEVLWPDFRPSHLLEAVVDFQGRQRRIGR